MWGRLFLTQGPAYLQSFSYQKLTKPGDSHHGPGDHSITLVTWANPFYGAIFTWCCWEKSQDCVLLGLLTSPQLRAHLRWSSKTPLGSPLLCSEQLSEEPLLLLSFQGSVQVAASSPWRSNHFCWYYSVWAENHPSSPFILREGKKKSV